MRRLLKARRLLKEIRYVRLRQTDVSGHYLHVVHIAPLYPFEQVPSQTGLKLINLKWQDVLI